jgi:Domain of unknown function (DUF4387)
MPELHELARLIRSKNAGPFELTIDVMFDSRANFERVRTCGALNTDRVAAVYGVDPTQVKYFDADVAMAIKITIPRPTPSGSLSDTDIFGGQFHSPLVRLEIP